MPSQWDERDERTNTERDGSVEALGKMLVGASVVAIIALIIAAAILIF